MCVTKFDPYPWNHRLPQGVPQQIRIRIAVPNVCYEHLCACVMVAVAAVGVADSICAQQLLLLYPTRLGYARSEIRPRATAVLVRCFVLPDYPTPRRELCWHQSYWVLFLAVVLLFWMARVDRCRTDSSISIWRAHAHRLARTGASCGKYTVGAATEVI